MTAHSTDDDKAAQTAGHDERADRLAQELRANLKRRKAQSRARRAGAAIDKAGEASGTDQSGAGNNG
ncbi:hypothetical protein [Amorphus sp. 3PC139-8]|uniref:hypothetical protein n=1 Tax=Amorphus sp. 3PC139-8 TaxID=2735676 RepID=UPI00345D892F